MQVKVANRMYRMSRNEFDGLLKIASEQVPFGIYAVIKEGYAELCCERCKSKTELKRAKQGFRSQGFKVYANGG